jgi:hypothetical protein
MAQTTIFSNAFSPQTSDIISLGLTNSANIECIPQPLSGFAGIVIFEATTLRDPEINLYFPLVPFNISPWIQIAELIFSAHSTTLSFNVSLAVFNSDLSIRARLVSSSFGSITIHMAY